MAWRVYNYTVQISPRDFNGIPQLTNLDTILQIMNLDFEGISGIDFLEKLLIVHNEVTEYYLLKQKQRQ